MNQNYNVPVIIVDIGTPTGDFVETFNDAFTKMYPTYKEAERFLLSGGAAYVYSEYTDTIPDTDIEYTRKVYNIVFPTEFGEDVDADGSSIPFVSFEVNGENISISYGDIDEGGGGEAS